MGSICPYCSETAGTKTLCKECETVHLRALLRRAVHQLKTVGDARWASKEAWLKWDEDTRAIIKEAKGGK